MALCSFFQITEIAVFLQNLGQIPGCIKFALSIQGHIDEFHPIIFWLNHSLSLFLQGFDEYMNLVLDEAEEVHLKKQTRKPLGKNQSYFAEIWF